MGFELKVFTDGASRGNPGLSALGVVITDEKDNILKTYNKFLGKYSNNFAEYSALIESISVLKNSGIEIERINFYSDSELVVKQIKGEYKIKHKDLINLSLEFWKQIKSLNKKFTISYIPRELNKTADKLANEALDNYLKGETDRSLLTE